MVGNPEETEEDIAKTLKLAKEINPDFTFFFYTTPFPGTELSDKAIENKWIKDLDYSNWYVRQTDAPIMQINFTREKLTKIRSDLQNNFVFRNYISAIKNPIVILNLLLIVARYPKGLLKGFRKAIKSKRVDDIVYSILKEYRMKRRSEIVSKKTDSRL